MEARGGPSPDSSHLDAEAGLHQVELVHQLLVERPHVLRHKLLVHGQAVLQDVSLRATTRRRSWTISKYVSF